MVRVAPVRLQYNPKILWFDPQGLELADGDPVVVRTERGLEFGHALDPLDVEDEQVEALKTKLKPVVRKATEQDIASIDELRRKGEEALPVFKRMAAETSDQMRPVMVEYLFEGDKAIFFFESEERIDFRDLVRRLSNELGVRVDMRQIGVRDEARMVGGLGHCGQELCCKRLGGEFCPVSIRMAKEQDLSLNPTKISGVCGRLMCCLRYEFDAYKDFKSRAPKINAKIRTPNGMAKVCDLDVPREMVTVKMEDDDKKKVTFPLSAMDEPEEGARPSSIGEVFEEYANPDPFADSLRLGSIDTSGFTREDKLADAKAVHNPSRKQKSAQDEEASGERKPSRRRRRRGGSGSQGKSGSAASGEGKSKAAKPAGEGKDAQRKSAGSEASGERKPSRRRRRRSSSASSSGAAGQSQAGAQQKATRPGQKSSSLAGSSQASSSSDTHRKARKRSHRSGGGQAGDAGKGASGKNPAGGSDAS